MESQNNFTSPSLCAGGGCDFYGSVENQNLCSKCYKNVLKRQQQRPEKSLSTSTVKTLECFEENESCCSSVRKKQDYVMATSGVCYKAKMQRCESCNKRVRLLGFECRCGYVFCGDHRYPENHACTFEYKKMQRQVLAIKNPLIKADKLRNRF